MALEKRRKTRIINLMGAARPHASVPDAVGDGTGDPSRERLLGCYRSIIEARAVYYPVAFELEAELGRGRQGIVFRGLRHGARGCVTQYAIKIYDPSIYRSADEYWTDMGRIAGQVSRLQKVQSPHLVMRHSYEETNGIGYVQMEAIDGLDLRRLLDLRQVEMGRARCSATEWAHFSSALFRITDSCVCLQPGVVVHVLRRVLRGLERLHDANFLHFDIKPGNIMIDRLGSVKIVDFGRAVQAGEPITFLLGSPAYMAPEMHEREPCRVSADLYSVGLVALEMLRGTPLVTRQEMSTLDEDRLLALKRDLPARVPDLVPEHVRTNDVLLEILQRLLEPDERKRFVSARDAEVGERGLSLIDKQLVQSGLDSECGRDLADFLAKMVDPGTDRIETPTGDPQLSDLPSETVYSPPKA